MHISAHLELPGDAVSRKLRARQQGYVVRAFHGTAARFDAFDLAEGQPNTVAGHGPHFASRRDEAVGYAAQCRLKQDRGRVLAVWLRVERPFVIECFGPDPLRASEQFDRRQYRQFVGEDFAGTGLPDNERALSDIQFRLAREPGMEFSAEDAPNRARWTEIYRRLTAMGYDAIVYPNTPADYSPGHYTKTVMLRTNHIRTPNAAFDPACQHSSVLTA